jgi:hypothetical protein
MSKATVFKALLQIQCATCSTCGVLELAFHVQSYLRGARRKRSVAPLSTALDIVEQQFHLRYLADL